MTSRGCARMVTLTGVMNSLPAEGATRQQKPEVAMHVNYITRHIDITDRFRQYVSDKMTKVEQLNDKAFELDVTVSRHHGGKGLVGGDRVELTLIGPGPVIRAESDGEDKYAAFDLALGRLIEQLRRDKDKHKVHRGGGHHHKSLHEASADGFRGLDIEPASIEVLEEVDHQLKMEEWIRDEQAS